MDWADGPTRGYGSADALWDGPAEFPPSILPTFAPISDPAHQMVWTPPGFTDILGKFPTLSRLARGS
ncbi:MAG: hypothetical protein ABGY41_02215, partial [Candidatus Poribacteria bacterium]